MTGGFEPTLQAAYARLAAVDPQAYARTRNSLDGAVTRLSPYITHGFLSSSEVLADVAARHPLHPKHRLVFELGWRAYFRHAWAHLGDGIQRSLHPGPLPDSAYRQQLPDDVLHARTGVPAIDCAVRELYTTGYLHNHARMWLASYLIHLRKVHWRTGAQWLYGHLLDGDLASNLLSWQWIAGTGSSKPYLFNAENVQRFAPPAWHSPNTILDHSYATMDRLARDPEPVAGVPGEGGSSPPALLTAPLEPFAAVDPGAVAGRDVWLVHPWSLGPLALPDGALALGVAIAEFHRQYPWTAQRWSFVGTRMRALAPLCGYMDAAGLGAALGHARSVRLVADPHLGSLLDGVLPPTTRRITPPALFTPVTRPCSSFSQWWDRTRLQMPLPTP